MPRNLIFGMLTQDPGPGDPGFITHALVPVAAPGDKELQGPIRVLRRLREVSFDEEGLRQEGVGLG